MIDSSSRVLLTRREAAGALGISVDTLARLLDAGELGFVRLGRSVLVPMSEVQSLVDRRLSTTGEPTTPVPASRSSNAWESLSGLPDEVGGSES